MGENHSRLTVVVVVASSTNKIAPVMDMEDTDRTGWHAVNPIEKRYGMTRYRLHEHEGW